MQALIGPLQELAEFEAIQKEKQKEAGVLQISGCVNSQKTHMMYALGDGCKYRVIACSSESKARQVYEEYHMLDPETYFYPAKDLLFFQADIQEQLILNQSKGNATGGRDFVMLGADMAECSISVIIFWWNIRVIPLVMCRH